MEQVPYTCISTPNLNEVSEILIKPFCDRTEVENNKLAVILESVGYFERCVADPTERRAFIISMSRYLIYKHFPKGAAICHPDDPELDFGIVIQGRAFEYEAKERKQIYKDAENYVKVQKFHQYRKLVEEMEFSKKLRKWVAAKDSWPCAQSPDGIKVLPVKTARFTQLYKTTAETLELAVNKSIGLEPEKGKAEGDLDYDEKFLLLHSDGSHNYFLNGTAAFKRVMEYTDGDGISQSSLLTGMSIRNPIIVAQELHMLSISHIDFYSLFSGRVGNLAEKKKFLWSLFPDLLLGMILKLGAAVMEKPLMKRDLLYEQGEEPGAIYILKTGGVQLLNYDDGEQLTKIPCSSNLTEATKNKVTRIKKKLIIGEIGEGGIFGEEEIINRTKRKYCAVCSKTPTLVYVLRKKVTDLYYIVSQYQKEYDILDKHFPVITRMYKYGIKNKIAWRQERIKKGIEVMSEIMHEAEPPKKLTKIIFKSSGLIELAEMQAQTSREPAKRVLITLKDLEQRNSRNTNSRVEIATVGIHKKIVGKPQFPKKLFEVNRTVKQPKRKQSQRSLSIVEPSKGVVTSLNRSHVNHLRHDSIVLPEKIPEEDDNQSSLSHVSHNKSPSQFSSRIWMASPVGSPTTPKPQSQFFQPRIMSAKAGGVLASHRMSPAHNTWMSTDKSARNSIIGKIFHADAAAAQNMISHNSIAKDSNSHSPSPSPRHEYEVNVSCEEIKNVNLSSQSNIFVKRIALTRPNFKKKELPEVNMNEVTPIGIKTIPRPQVQVLENQDVVVPKLNLSMQKPNTPVQRPSTANPKLGSHQKAHNYSHNYSQNYSLVNSPGTPKALSITARLNNEAECLTPSSKMVFVLNRGTCDPRVVLVDHEVGKSPKMNPNKFKG